MTAKKKNSGRRSDAAGLRKRAEALLRTNPSEAPTLPTSDVQALIHELNVHQMELEIQNEELRQSQLELSRSRDRFSDLFDFAPVGYVMLDMAGIILEANLAAAAMLGAERKRLAGSNISKWLDHADQDMVYLHRQAVFADPARQTCEVTMRKADGATHSVRLESIAVASDREWQCRTALIDVTAQKQASNQLEESEKRYQRLTNAVTDYVYRVRVEDGRPVETLHEPNCEAVTGYSPEEFLENPLLWIAMAPLEDRPLIERQAACVLSNQDAPPIEHRIQRKDGMIRWVSNTVSPQRNARGRLLGYDGLLRDITEKKEVEAAVNRLNATLEERVAYQTREVRLLAEAMANLGEGVMITSDHIDWPGPKILYVNDAMCRITGYDARELIGQTPRILQGEKTDRKAIQRLQQALGKKRSHLCEVVNYRKGGEPYHAEIFVSPLFDAKGNHTNFIAIHRDITERKRAEKAVLESQAQTKAVLKRLREREARIRAILNTAADAIVTIDAHGAIVDTNPATQKMFGYTEEELRGQNVNLLMPSPYHEEHDAYLKNYRKTGKAKIIGIGREVFARKKDGAVFPIDLAVSEITEMGLFTGIIRDISDRKNLEQEVLKVAEDEKLQIGRELHDGLGAHLSGVELLCEVLESKLAAKSLPETADLENISSLVRDAVSQARSLAHGLHAVRPGPEELMVALQNLAHRINRDFEPSCDFDCPAPILVADQVVANHLFRIAQEAVNNALKHANATRITMGLTRTNERIILGIRDDGQGMPKSVTRKPGIGLRTMQYRAGVMNGSLMVQMPPEGGVEIVCSVTLAAV